MKKFAVLIPLLSMGLFFCIAQKAALSRNLQELTLTSEKTSPIVRAVTVGLEDVLLSSTITNNSRVNTVSRNTITVNSRVNTVTRNTITVNSRVNTVTRNTITVNSRVNTVTRNTTTVNSRVNTVTSGTPTNPISPDDNDFAAHLFPKTKLPTPRIQAENIQAQKS